MFIKTRYVPFLRITQTSVFLLREDVLRSRSNLLGILQDKTLLSWLSFRVDDAINTPTDRVPST